MPPQAGMFSDGKTVIKYDQNCANSWLMGGVSVSASANAAKAASFEAFRWHLLEASNCSDKTGILASNAKMPRLCH